MRFFRPENLEVLFLGTVKSANFGIPWLQNWAKYSTGGKMGDDVQLQDYFVCFSVQIVGKKAQIQVLQGAY